MLVGTPVAAAAGTPRSKSFSVAATASVAGTVVALGSLAVIWVAARSVDGAPSAQAIPETPSIAVLPFVNMSSDPESEHFADGLSQELQARLAGISGLRVAGRTSSFYFKNKQEPLPVIAKSLNVSHVLEGSVRRSGEQLRITAQLVNSGGGTPLWSQTFDRELTDTFQVQEDIAISVASALRVELLAEDEQRIRRRGTSDPEAHRLFLIGNAHLTGISVKRDLERARQLFEQATARDPHFAAAHARLAYYHFYRAWAMADDVGDGVRLGMAAAQRAVALDPASSDALQARANFAMWRYRFLGDYAAFVAASDDFRRAIEFDPYNDTALFDYGRAVLWHEPDLAQSLFERTVQIEPLRRRAGGMAALTRAIRGDPDSAREMLRVRREQVPVRQPGDAAGAAGFEQYYGRLDEAVVAAEEALSRGGLESPLQVWGLYMSLGDLEAATQALDFGDTDLAGYLRDAAAQTMRGNYVRAFDVLDEHRGEFSEGRMLDLPAARLALIAGRPAQARAILEARMPDLVAGIEPINGHNTMPALDLVAAWQATDGHALSRGLLERVAAYLDDPLSPRLPLFMYQRARAHALTGEREHALRELDRAYDAGFRTLWASDLHPEPLYYIDSIESDPAFAALRSQARYQNWLSRIRTDNARQRARLKARLAARPNA
jgi:TolB-like protein